MSEANGAPPSRRAQSWCFASFPLLLAALAAAPVQAQTAAERLFDSCRSASAGHAGLGARCGDAALAAEALQGGLGFLLTAGGPIPVSPSTAGRRLPSAPRVIVDAGVGWASYRYPDLARAPVGGAVGDRRAYLLAPRISAAVGLFEGFSPAPGVAGILGVDLVAAGQYLRLNRGSGFDGSSWGWGVGTRIGVVRESFSLPGVTLSLMHYRMGGVRHGSVETSGAATTLRPRATSLRAIVGKDLFAVGISGGIGWDRYGGDATIEVAVPSNPSQPQGAQLSGGGGPRELALRRRYLFVGANYTWVVAQVAAELVWAGSTTPRSDLVGSGAFRTGERELQGTVSVRVTY